MLWHSTFDSRRSSGIGVRTVGFTINIRQSDCIPEFVFSFNRECADILGNGPSVPSIGRQKSSKQAKSVRIVAIASHEPSMKGQGQLHSSAILLLFETEAPMAAH